MIAQLGMFHFLAVHPIFLSKRSDKLPHSSYRKTYRVRTPLPSSSGIGGSLHNSANSFQKKKIKLTILIETTYLNFFELIQSLLLFSCHLPGLVLIRKSWVIGNSQFVQLLFMFVQFPGFVHNTCSIFVFEDSSKRHFLHLREHNKMPEIYI